MNGLTHSERNTCLLFCNRMRG